MIGHLFKSKRHHPDRVFLVTEVKRVKKGTLKTHRIFGLEITDDAAVPAESSYLQEDFSKRYPIIMWAPANG